FRNMLSLTLPTNKSTRDRPGSWSDKWSCFDNSEMYLFRPHASTVPSFCRFLFEVGHSMPQLTDLCKPLSLLHVVLGVFGEEVMSFAKGTIAALSPFALSMFAVE